MSKRDYIEEIINKKSRLLPETDRTTQYRNRIIPIVTGFRKLKAMSDSTDFKNEWLKYGAIGFVACTEGYFRLLIADIINSGEPYISNLSRFKDIKFGMDHIIGIHSGKVTLGDFVSHLLPMNSVSDINAHLSALLDVDFIKHFNGYTFKEEISINTLEELFPETIGNVQKLFELRHLYSHELVTKEVVNIALLEGYIASTAFFQLYTEIILTEDFLLKS